MSRNALDQFGELLMGRVRDKAIREWDMILDGSMKSASSQRIRSRLSTFDSDPLEVLRWLLPQITDTVLHHLLWTLEQEEWVDVALKTDAEVVASIREASDGLAGELYSEEGWVARFSRQRRVEP